MPATKAARKVSGFTLVELMVVMVIIGLTLGLATLNAVPSPRQDLQKEAQRIALLLQLARDEAIVRNRLVTFEANSDRYHFLVKNETRWDLITGDDMLRERSFKNAPLQLLLDPGTAGASNPLRITFGREPVDKPFVLTLASGDASVAIHADGVGHFVVEQ
ncbi:GspH/FimT family pseudopilin [Massilia horti]|uniref:Type II secretion system protein H n=1 Tax=Massilia horti TaxID=2562153 RepID=A0A4Y9T8F7_9BURK|nr:GspH/FimT family pseudopilin [Massilia horti]TFW34118.1 type II secretion system protein GspH [Massilia horti]